MKYPDDVRAESQVEEELMTSLYESEFDEDFIKRLEFHLNEIGTDMSMNQAEKIALTAYIFIEMTDSVLAENSDELRPELLLAAMDDAANFDKVVKKSDPSDKL